MDNVISINFNISKFNITNIECDDITPISTTIGIPIGHAIISNTNDEYNIVIVLTERYFFNDFRFIGELFSKNDKHIFKINEIRLICK